jgi:hypothetical protein
MVTLKFLLSINIMSDKHRLLGGQLDTVNIIGCIIGCLSCHTNDVSILLNSQASALALRHYKVCPGLGRNPREGRNCTSVLSPGSPAPLAWEHLQNWFCGDTRN